ncbi:hypothetical protein Psyaliredsea_01640 [Psychrobacter alimentarius]
MADNQATLTVDGKDYQLPIIKGTLGPSVIEVAAFQKAGYWTYDPGFMATAPVESKITFIDGGKGELLHRGYPIDQLANNAEYLEVAYALIHGDLPNSEQKADFFKKSANIRVFMINCVSSLKASAVMHIQWLLWLVSLVRYQRSIMSI